MCAGYTDLKEGKQLREYWRIVEKIDLVSSFQLHVCVRNPVKEALWCIMCNPAFDDHVGIILFLYFFMLWQYLLTSFLGHVTFVLPYLPFESSLWDVLFVRTDHGGSTHTWLHILTWTSLKCSKCRHHLQLHQTIYRLHFQTLPAGLVGPHTFILA